MEVNLIGNATRDPEMRYTQSGRAVLKLDIAVNRWAGEGKDPPPPVYVEVTCWQQLAENVADSVTKGTRVIVLGRLELQQWETESGDKRSKLKVIATDVGTSLMFATADVKRTPKGEGGGSRSGGRSQPAEEAGDWQEEEPF